MHRVLPGDLVSFKSWISSDPQQLPKVQVVGTRATRGRKGTSFNTGEEADRIAEIRKELEATNSKHLYMVLMASKEKALLMRSHDSKYVVCQTNDLINHTANDEVGVLDDYDFDV